MRQAIDGLVHSAGVDKAAMQAQMALGLGEDGKMQDLGHL